MTIKSFLQAKCCYAAAAVAVLACGGARADTLSFTFADAAHQGDVGTVHTYSAGTPAHTITAYGYATANASPTYPASIGDSWSTGAVTAADLFAKYSAGDAAETGLGLAASSDHEIENNQFISLDLSSLRKDGYRNVALTIGSIQSGEGYYVFGSTGAADPSKPGTLIAEYVGPSLTSTIQIDDSITMVSVTAITPWWAGLGGTQPDLPDVLLMNGLTAVGPSTHTSTTPLPPAALGGMLLMGGLGISQYARRARVMTA